MNGRCPICVYLLFYFFLLGCAGGHSPSNAVWTATPVIQETENPLFAASIKPLKNGLPYYAAFLLTVESRTDDRLIIDWNQTRYLFNNRPEGAVVFEGIDPSTVKTGTIPPDTVLPGTIFSRNILPMRLISWNPIKDQSAESKSITPGMMPVGENGIRLAVRHGNGLITVLLAVRISRDSPPLGSWK